jgi:type I restriction enzyme R subunit
MAFTDKTEKGFETIIVNWLVDQNGYEQGTNDDYNKEYAVDETRLFRFLNDTQPREMAKLGVNNSDQKKRQFLNRLSGEIAKRGIIDVLRNGVKAYPADLIMFYFTPTENNEKSKQMFEKNIFSVTRQLRYSIDASKLALDLCLFINGLPVITIELKNHFTGQTTADAVEQYKEDRDPRDTLFSFKRCMVHFAVDDQTIMFCTKLAGKDSWFLPFNKGYNDGTGNPPNPDGIMTDYLWKDILTKWKLSRIIENYAQVVVDEDPDTKKKTVKQIWPRYHQLDCVEKLLADVKQNGVGKRYLIQHSAGSGKSNSIAWLAHQLIGLEQDGHPMIDSVIVVTDRRILDKQIRDTIKQFMQVKNTVVWAQHSGDLKKAIQDGKRIIITTVEKFPYISQEIGQEHIHNHFAIIIDEAHSGQSGRNSANMNLALSGMASDNEMDNEDKINAIVEGRKLVKTASYFAFTATPKNKTEEVFGTPYEEDGEIKHRPFHVYTMKQAIQEGFILDVLKNYTAIDSWYKIAKKVEDDPMFDKKRAQKKLRSFVEGNPDVIAKKAAMMVDHFHEQIIAKKKLNGKSRAMVVTASIPRCIETYYAINKCLADRHSPYKAIIAFSGECKYNGQEPALTSAGLNGFPDAKIPKEFKKDPYRLLVVADMFQTGFDEPLLQTMYVDKPLYDIAAVQTLSRLNRAAPGKDEVYVLDFANKTSTIQDAFSKFYRTTILSGETDPNKLYDLITLMESYQVYDNDDVEHVVDLFLGGAERDRLDPLLDPCVATYNGLETDDQIKFKSAAKSFVRTYGFLGSILPYGNVDWEKLSIFLNLLIPKLPSPREDDLSEGILSTIDLDSYRNEAQEAVAIKLEDEDAEIAPVPAGKVGHIVEPELDPLSKIIMDFNDMFGNIQWNDADNVQRQILQIPAMVSRDEKYQNAMKNSDEQEARTESERALQKVIFSIMADNMELFKQFQDNPSFKKWLTNMVFNMTYNKEGKPYEAPDDLDSPKVASDNFTSYRYPTEAPRSGMMVADGKVTFGEKKDSDSKK